ncbi:hypothetical protein [Chlamydia caviae]|uniref:Uncharacterized protein n=1 Tax=Chlamydia caviae (strain ATCC VR-813 / DSM 19441 / 03DC25 / GPIC) TaxID=227941 RepID=Q823U5_CHLCV|nr:hypothetical protein [Chlamydia caviae]AAP05059.1 hypothetical protein CCA_00310 [Chlamydia caviae GPIC]
MKKILCILCFCSLLPVSTVFSVEEVQEEETEQPAPSPAVCPFKVEEAS